MFRYLIFVVCLLLFAFSYNYVAVVNAQEVREDCRVCGMWIDQYMQTRHVLTTADGTNKIYFCSFTCAAKYIKKHGADIKQLQAADYLTADLVSAEKAIYLVGSEAPPVMSSTSIIAFAGKESADKFQKLHGGKTMTIVQLMTMD